MRLELLVLGADETCAYCGAHLPAASQAWWVEDEQAFVCTACVPFDDAHSISHGLARERRARPRWR